MKQIIGWVLWNQLHKCAVWTGRGSAKLYCSESSAKSARAQSSWTNKGDIVVRPVYFGDAE